jgi:acetyl-CoA carboxylase biotin carboxylase subunit
MLINKILIANRGEIAVRIIRACRELNIISAVMYSDADKLSLHTRLADESYNIGKSSSSHSYLNKEKIINLAKKIKADAVHPGYGFLSENAEFIKLLENEGLIFIGPSSKSVEMMGNKTTARELMSKIGIPIVPGTIIPIENVNAGIEAAEKIGYPLLLKAAAGGGGKGMRKILSSKEFNGAFDGVRREAMKAFANDSIYIEKYIENPRHIEVQIIADKYGNYAHLFERECSIQRRHQKIIEESPSSFLDPFMREKITKTAVDVAKACCYYNAGTIEFLMESSDIKKNFNSGQEEKKFYFLEMNTRLQVEHPVTEMITGVDLVKEQISIAAGNMLSFNQDDIKIIGHSFECRIYAEDPLNNFVPSSGKIKNYITPSGPGIRVDGGFSEGSEITIHYDPLIAKLICWAENRMSAVKRMKSALSEYQIGGIINNIPFLITVFNNEDFVKGNIDINYLQRVFGENCIQGNKTENDYMEDAAAIFIALMKEKSFGIKRSDAYYSVPKNLNKWTDLMYE